MRSSMASPRRSWSLPLLPPEIIQEIFYKTPAEALVRSKPTCKKWYSLITDKRFISQHFQRSQERFIRIFDTVQIMDPITSKSSVSPIPNELLQYPYKIGTLVYTLLVHCDGLILVGYHGWKYRDDESQIPNVALWNPVLKKVRWVEPAGCITSSDFYGIGYNSDGYKLVRFTCRPFVIEGYEDAPEVEVYEFKTSSWRTVGGKVDDDVEITCKCVSVLGNMYWVAYRVQKPKEEFIRVFDFSDETFKDICFCPPCYGDNSHLSCFNGDSLSLLQQDEVSRNIEVWVSSKLGDGDVSFSKYFSLCGPVLPALRGRNDATRYVYANPVYCFVKPKSVIVWCVGVEGEDDEVCTCFTLYEIDENGVRNEKVTERDYMHDYSDALVCGYVYVPSMIPLPWV